MDNLIDAEMIKDYLNGKVGSPIPANQEAQAKEFVSIFRHLNGKIFRMN